MFGINIKHPVFVHCDVQMSLMSFNPRLQNILKTLSNETREKQRNSQFNPWEQPLYIFSFKTRVLMETSNFPGYIIYSFTASAKCHVLQWMPQEDFHSNSIKWMSITETKAKAELRRIQWNMGVFFSHLTCIAHRSVPRTKSMLRKIKQICSKERCPSMQFPPLSKPGLHKPVLSSKTSSYFTIHRRRSHKA